jgi:hypothetical protein
MLSSIFTWTAIIFFAVVLWLAHLHHGPSIAVDIFSVQASLVSSVFKLIEMLLELVLVLQITLLEKIFFKLVRTYGVYCTYAVWIAELRR